MQSFGDLVSFNPHLHVLADRRRIERPIKFANGTPENPLSEAELHAKVVSLVEPVLGAAACTGLLDRVAGLESVKDFRDVIQLLVPDARVQKAA